MNKGRGTIFQRKVWRALSDIPFGQVVTYQDLAYRIGHPKSARAVGNAVAKNPLPLFNPCHRVIRADGQIGKFSFFGGTTTKAFLLQVERNTIRVLHLLRLKNLDNSAHSLYFVSQVYEEKNK